MNTHRTAGLSTITLVAGLAGVVVLGALACSGAAPSDLYATDALNGGSNPAPSGVVVDDAGGVASPPASADATSPAAGDSAPPVVGPKDAGQDAAVPDAAGKDASPAPRGLTCGSKSNGQPRTCAAADECCFDSAQSTKLACVARGTCGGFTLDCGSALDCPAGQQCCGTFDRTNGYDSVTCMDACPEATSTSTYPQLCTGNPSECPTGTTCQVSGTLTGYSICK